MEASDALAADRRTREVDEAAPPASELREADSWL
jgi:hypothetical protein